MEKSNNNIQQNKICQFCHSNIKSKEDFFTCPSCLSIYHLECWYENKGCAVYGCNYKLQNSEEQRKTFNVGNILVNAEYLINKKQFEDAINECNRILNIDPSDIEAKKMYNKAVTSLNIKIRILEDAERAFALKDYKSAELYYRNSIGYLSDAEKNVINARLEVIKESIPAMMRKELYKKLTTYFLLILVFLSVLFIAYYFIYLEEDREYYAIEKDDNTEEVRITENQISRYENFLRRYENGKFKYKASEKINLLSASLIQKIYRDDWKTALKYINKIDENSNPKLRIDLFKLVYEVAEKEYVKHKSDARKLNSQKKFLEAKNETEKALSIITYFPGTDIDKEKLNIGTNLNLLNRKISYLVKYKDIEKELNEKLDEIKKSREVEPVNLVKINAIITDDKNKNYYLAKNINDNNLIALKTAEIENYKKGDVVILECRKSGKIMISDEKSNEISVPLYKYERLNRDNDISTSIDMESILQRVDYLKSQKSKIDSLFNVSL